MKKKKVILKCGTCVFFEPLSDSAEFKGNRCLRYPPTPMLEINTIANNVSLHSHWPRVEPFHRCGEHQPKKEA